MARSLMLLGALGTTGAAFAACRSPTQISVVVTTDVPCAHVGGAMIAVGVLGTDGGIDDRPASATKSTCDSDGNVGSVVLVPSGARDEAIAFRVVVGVDRSPEACTSANASGCIIARRALRFLPHESLTVPVAMRASCEGVACTPDTTCVNGACVSAIVVDPGACEGDGCPESVLLPADGGAPDAGRVDGGADAASDAGGADVGDAGDATTPFAPSCGDMSGLQAGAPWPMDGYCPTLRRRSPYAGPQATPPPTIKWKSAASRPVFAPFAPLIAADGMVYKLADQGIYAYAPSNGAETVRFAAPETLEWAPAIAPDGTIYVPGATRVFGLLPDGGTRSIAAIGRSNFVLGAGPTIYFSDPTSNVAAYGADLSSKWFFHAPGATDYVTPAVSPSGTIYVASNDGTVSAIALDGGGAPIGSLPTSVGETFHAAFAPDGRVRISAASAATMTSMTAAGTVAWTWPAADAGRPGDPRPFAIGDDATTYVAHTQGDLVALRADGSVKWTTTTKPACNAVTLGADGLVYSGCADGVYAFSPVDGSVVWRVPMAQALLYACSIGADHVLYLSASDGYLYAIGN